MPAFGQGCAHCLPFLPLFPSLAFLWCPSLPPAPYPTRSSWGQAERVAAFLREPARAKAGVRLSRPLMGTAISVQASTVGWLKWVVLLCEPG